MVCAAYEAGDGIDRGSNRIQPRLGNIPARRPFYLHAPRPALVGATTGVLMQGANIGSLLGPPVVAMLVSAGGWSWALYFTTPVLACAVLAAWILHRAEQRLPHRA